MKSKFISSYKFLALLLLNTFLFLLVLNIGLYFFYQYKDKSLKKTNPIAQKYGMENVLKAYPGMTNDQVDELLTETWNRPQGYESFTGFKEKSFKGKYVNVSDEGIRASSPNAPWPIDTNAYNIFIFGGSTTFGYGVADNETISSYLQKLFRDSLQTKNIHCYNFGSGFYYSVQERILLENLLLNGIVPNVAIFIDGLNDFYFEEPFYTKEGEKVFNHQPASLFKDWALSLPISRLAKSVSYRIFNKSSDFYDLKENCDEAYLQKIITRYFNNKALTDKVASMYDVKTFHFWQPISCYEYSPKEKLFFDKDNNTCFPKCGYESMRKFLAKNSSPENFFWLAHMQSNITDNLYVDRNHYSAHMNQLIAGKIYYEIENELKHPSIFSIVTKLFR